MLAFDNLPPKRYVVEDAARKYNADILRLVELRDGTGIGDRPVFRRRSRKIVLLVYGDLIIKSMEVVRLTTILNYYFEESHELFLQIF